MEKNEIKKRLEDEGGFRYELADYFGISPKTLRRWIVKKRPDLAEGQGRLTPKEVKILFSELWDD